MSNQNKELASSSALSSKEKKSRRGKVINHFTVEVVDCQSCPELSVNPSNPYSQMSDEERMRDLIEMFSILWSETCREHLKKLDNSDTI